MKFLFLLFLFLLLACGPAPRHESQSVPMVVATSTPVENYRPISEFNSNLPSSVSSVQEIPVTPTPGENGRPYGELNAKGQPKTHYVHGYTRKDGTKVKGYWRS
jgi:hypothetical protein